MNRSRLQMLLSSALFAALAPACGGAVFDEPVSGDAAGDAGGDAASDTFTPTDTATDTAADTAHCRPITSNIACSEQVTYPCGLPIKLTPDGPTTEECKVLCDPIPFSSGGDGPMFCSVWIEEGGAGYTVSCPSCAVGRKPADLIAEIPPNGEDPIVDPVARTLAEMARVEAASVHAFRRLSTALSELGADTSTLGRVQQAARDEIAHARRVSAIARRRGAAIRPLRFERSTPTVFELALENAVEGCVHETLGVAYLEHQRLHAADPELRALADSLYEDELSHASLSWELRAFFDARLSDDERAQLRVATDRALDDVADEIKRIDPRVRRALGLPSARAVAALVAGLRTSLFSQALEPATLAA